MSTHLNQAEGNKGIDLSKKLRVKPWIPDKPRSIIFKNALLIDPRASCIYKDAHIWIEGGIVKDIYLPERLSQSKSFSVNSTEVDLEVDLENKLYLCPGLIDCHVHVTAVPGVQTVKEAMETPEQLVALRSTFVIREMLFRGFTTVRDTGGANSVLAEAVEEGLLVGPRLIQCGKALSQTGGHADFRSVNGPMQTCCGGHETGLGRTCDGVPAVLTATRDEIRKGAKFIKVMCGGGVASPTDALESVQFTSEEIQAITTVCRNMGNIPSTAHAYSVAAIRHAISNGITGIEHGNFIDRQTAEMMAQNDIFLTPTLSCYGIMFRPPFGDFLPPSGKIKNQEVMDSGLNAIQLAEECGVTVCYGSDLLISMHALQTEEFSIRAKVLPSPTVLKHATINAARLLRMKGKVGEIVPGAYADLVILDANPLEDISVLDKHDRHLKAVIKEGRVFRSTIQHLVVDVS